MDKNAHVIEPDDPKNKPASKEDVDKLPDGSGDPSGEAGEDEHAPED
jgi:hypothetical protein